jgi:hypothetical protein
MSMANHNPQQNSSSSDTGATEARRLKRRSVFLSIACAALFAIELALLFSGAGIGYVLLAGLVGAGLAIADRVYVHVLARERFFGKN